MAPKSKPAKKNAAKQNAPKRQRSDSTTAAVKAAQNAAKAPIQPPPHIKLRPTDLPFWESVVRARARDLWNASDLENAANLARCKADLERLQLEVQKDGDIVTNAKGTQIVNPKHVLIETLTRRAMALSRMLHVHAEATVGSARTEKSVAEKERQAASAAVNADDDSLIAPATCH